MVRSELYFLAIMSIFCFFFRRGREEEEEEDVPTREDVDCDTLLKNYDFLYYVSKYAIMLF